MPRSPSVGVTHKYPCVRQELIRVSFSDGMKEKQPKSYSEARLFYCLQRPILARQVFLNNKLAEAPRWGPDPTFNRSSQNHWKQKFSRICCINARIGVRGTHVLAQLLGGCYPLDTAGPDPHSPNGSNHTQPRLQA